MFAVVPWPMPLKRARRPLKEQVAKNSTGQFAVTSLVTGSPTDGTFYCLPWCRKIVACLARLGHVEIGSRAATTPAITVEDVHMPVILSLAVSTAHAIRTLMVGLMGEHAWGVRHSIWTPQPTPRGT